MRLTQRRQRVIALSDLHIAISDEETHVEEVFDRLPERPGVDDEGEKAHLAVLGQAVPLRLSGVFLLGPTSLDDAVQCRLALPCFLLEQSMDVLAQGAQIRILGLLEILGFDLFGPDCVPGIPLLQSFATLGLFADLLLDGQGAEEEARHRGPEVVGEAGAAAEPGPVELVAFIEPGWRFWRAVFVIGISSPSSSGGGSGLGACCCCVVGPSAHECNAFPDEIIDIDTLGIVAKVQLGGSFGGEIGS